MDKWKSSKKEETNPDTGLPLPPTPFSTPVPNDPGVVSDASRPVPRVLPGENPLDANSRKPGDAQSDERDGEAKVLVESYFDSVHTIGLPATGDNAGAAITLMPGPNQVPARAWEKAKQQEMVKIQIREGNLLEMNGKSLEETGEKASVKTVEKTVDRKLLDTWARAEKRPAVLKAINAQLDKIGPSKPEETTKKGDEE